MAFSNSASAERSGVAASMLFAVVAACITLVSFAAGCHKSYCSGCIKVKILILICSQKNVFKIGVFLLWRRDPGFGAAISVAICA